MSDDERKGEEEQGVISKECSLENSCASSPNNFDKEKSHDRPKSPLKDRSNEFSSHSFNFFDNSNYQFKPPSWSFNNNERTFTPGPPQFNSNRETFGANSFPFECSNNNGANSHEVSSEEHALLQELLRKIKIGELVEATPQSNDGPHSQNKDESVRSKQSRTKSSQNNQNFNDPSKEQSFPHSHNNANKNNSAHKEATENIPHNFYNSHYNDNSQNTAQQQRLLHDLVTKILSEKSATPPPIQVFNQQSLPPPELPFFKGGNLESFNKFLVYMENHFRQNLPNNLPQWTQILLKQVAKDIRNHLPPDAEYSWDYHHIVSSIQDYLKLMGPKDDNDPVMTFLRMTRYPNETVKAFSYRLLQAFRMAYPPEYNSYNENKILIEKYKENLPDEIKEFVTRSTLLQRSMGQLPNFETHVYLAENYKPEVRYNEPRAKAYPPPSKPYVPPNAKNINPYYNKFNQNLEEPVGAEGPVPYMEQFPQARQNKAPPGYIFKQPMAPHPETFYAPSPMFEGHNFIPNSYFNQRSINNPAPTHVPHGYLQAGYQAGPFPPNNRLGTCEYCSRPGHDRGKCKLLAAREKEPDLVWCEKCHMKNHLAIHCQAKVNINKNNNNLSFPKINVPPTVVETEIVSESVCVQDKSKKIYNNNNGLVKYSMPHTHSDAYLLSKVESNSFKDGSNKFNSIKSVDPKKIKSKVGKSKNSKRLAISRVPYDRYVSNAQNIKCHLSSQPSFISSSCLPLPEISPPSNHPSKLERQFNPKWIQQLDQEQTQHVKSFSVYNNNIMSFKLIHNNEEFQPGDSVLINSLHKDNESRPMVIVNKPKRIKVTNESFDSPTTTCNMSQNFFWVNANNHFILSLVDSGAESSTIREDIVTKLGLTIIPPPEGEVNFSVGLLGKVPLLGTAMVTVKFLDIDLGVHKFKVMPNTSKDCDELVLGIDFLVSKKLVYIGDRHLLQGYVGNTIWIYQSNPNLVRRILCNINCYATTNISVKSQETIQTEVSLKSPNHLINSTLHDMVIPNFSCAIQANFIRPLNTDDIQHEETDVENKYYLNHYTASPDNYYVIDLQNPKMEIVNGSNKMLKYKPNDLIGKAYSVNDIYMNLPNIPTSVQESLKRCPDTYITLKDTGPFDVSPVLKECLLKNNIADSESETKLNHNSQSSNKSSYNNNLVDNNNTDDPLLSDFNLPDEYELKDPSEWTEESLRASVKIGNCPEDIKEKFFQLLWKFKDTVSNSTTVPSSSLPEVHFIPKDNKISHVPQYKFNPASAAEVDKIVEDLFKAGIIERSNSLHNNPIHLVRKRDGSGRIVIDMRVANSHLELPSPSPLPSVEDIMTDLHGMKVYSSLDMLAGFLQIGISKDSRPYTAFTATNHRYQYTRLPFGFKASPIEYTRLLNVALTDMLQHEALPGDNGVKKSHCRIYVDDVGIYTVTYEDHLYLLERLFNLLKGNNLKLKLEKCSFLSDSMKFLGFNFTQQGVEKDKKYVEKILNLSKPVLVRDVMRLLGSCVYIHRFIPGYATVARALTSIASPNRQKMKTRVVWTQEMEQSYTRLKELVAEHVLLTYPDYSAEASPLILSTDASTSGTGAVLQQLQDGDLKFIAFSSSTFTQTQLNYTTTELELLAVKAGIRAFRIFLQVKPFILRTDHAPLQHLVKLRPFNGRIARTLEYLSNFEFTVEWVPGAQNVLPDLLSRVHSWDIEGKKIRLNDQVDTHGYLPPGKEIDFTAPGSGDSLLLTLLTGKDKVEKVTRNVTSDDADELRLKLWEEIHKHPSKYNLNLNEKSTHEWYAVKARHYPVPVCFIQAFANLFKYNVAMYFGLDYPISFISDKLDNKEPHILIQSLANSHFNLLRLKHEPPCVKFLHEHFVKTSQSYGWEDLVNIDLLLSDDEAFDSVLCENLDFFPSCNPPSHTHSSLFLTSQLDRETYIKQISEQENNIINLSNENPLTQNNKASLDVNKVYEQKLDGSFELVHPLSYANQYSRCCNHNYNSESFVPVSCGPMRFCANLDSGSTTSVLSMSIANKLFEAKLLTKLYDTKINLFCTGGKSQCVDTRVVTADITIGTGIFHGVKFILLPDEMMFSCALIGNEVLSLRGIEMDFGTRLLRFDGGILVEMARLKHPRFYTHRHSPPITGNAVDPVSSIPYIKHIDPEGNKELIDFLSIKTSQDRTEEPILKLEHFINEIDLLQLQQNNKDLRNLRKVMAYPNFKLPIYLSHYNHVKGNLQIINDIIYFKKDPYDPVPLLPTNCIITIALQIHDKYFHVGRDKLLDWVKNIAYHVKLSELLSQLTSSCPTCILRKWHSPKFVAPTIKIQTDHPFQMVVADLLSMPQHGSYHYILNVIDHYSKLAASCPLKDKSSHSVARAFERHILPKFLITPKVILTDNGREFVSAEFRDMLLSHNIKHVRSASYRAESHGCVERYNKSLLEYLRVHADVSNDWPSVLDDAVLCYNTSRHGSHKMSPAEFLLTEKHAAHKRPKLTAKDIQYWRVGNPGFKSHKLGSLVMKIIPRVGNRDVYKLRTLYVGPFKIIKVHTGGTSYAIRSLDDYSIISNVHHSQLRAWVAPTKILLKNPDFFNYYNLYRPLTPLEENRHSDECDATESRQFHANWRPSDDLGTIERENLSDDFLLDPEGDENTAQNNEPETEQEDEPISTQPYQPCTRTIIFSPQPHFPPQARTPHPPNSHSGLGESNNCEPHTTPMSSEPPVSFINNPISPNNSTSPERVDNVKGKKSNQSTPKCVNFVLPDLSKPPPGYVTPPPFSPSPPSTSPYNTCKSPPAHHPSPNTYFSSPPYQQLSHPYFNSPSHHTSSMNRNNFTPPRESYTPPFNDKIYQHLISGNLKNDDLFLPQLKPPNFDCSPTSQENNATEEMPNPKLSPSASGPVDNVPISSPPSNSPQQNYWPPPKYKTYAPTRMVTRSQTKQ